MELIDNHGPDHGSIRAAMFDFTNHRIRQALYNALQRGVKIRMILDRGQYQNARIDTKNQLHRIISHPRCHTAVASGRIVGFAGRMHYKLLICHNGAACGGMNWTEAGEKFNYDLMTKISDADSMNTLHGLWKECYEGLTTSAVDHDGQNQKGN